MKKIIVPCDFSATALEAVRFASDIAGKANGEVTLLHTIALPTMNNSSFGSAFKADYKKDMKLAAITRLQKIKSKYVDANVKVRIEVQFGDLLSRLKRTIKSEDYDLIVMGTRGASGLREYTIGSNAEKVARNSSVPVISMRKAPEGIENIVFPVRPDLDQEQLTMRVKELQNFFNAKLHVVFVNTPARFKKDADSMPLLEKFAKRFMLKNYTLSIFSDSSEEDGIINFSGTLGRSMVAMRTHGRKGIPHLVTGSIAEDVLNHIKCPIWTVKIR